jgi:hypothetical protein
VEWVRNCTKRSCSEWIYKCDTTNSAAIHLGNAGLFRRVRGTRRCDYVYVGQDVLAVKSAFDKHPLPVFRTPPSQALITLRKAMKDFLGHGEGFASVVKGVLAGVLVPLAKSGSIYGITGYIFQQSDLRSFVHISGSSWMHGDFFTQREAARLLETDAHVVRALVKARIFTSIQMHAVLMLIPVEQVRTFADQYQSTRSIAEACRVSINRVLAELGRLKVVLLEIRIPGTNRFALFVPRKTAESLRSRLTDVCRMKHQD